MLLFIFIIYLGKVSLESCFKYFIIQSLSSVLFLFCFLSANRSTFFIVIFRILIKLGIFPFHQWIISLCDKLDWDNIYYLTTLQKIIPFYLLSFFSVFEMFKFIFFIGLINTFVRILGCFNHSNFRLIYGFMSIFHQSWILLGLLSEALCGLLYLIGYIIISIPFFFFFIYIGSNSISFFNTRFRNFFFLFMIFGLLVGVPPLSGFLLKLYVSLMFIYTNIYICLFLVILSRIFFFYVYCRILFICIFSYINRINNFCFSRDLSLFHMIFFFVGLPLFSIIF